MNKEEKGKGDVIRVEELQFAKPVCYRSWSGQRNMYNLKTWNELQYLTHAVYESEAWGK